MIENKQHAREILSYVMPGEREDSINQLIAKVDFVDSRKIRKINSDRFWDEIILGTPTGKSFVQKRRITSLDELISSHYDWKMKYQWRIYKTIKPNIDLVFDELDSANYLD